MGIDATERGDPSDRTWRGITRVEWGAAAVAAVVLAGLAIAEPDILGAPFENTRTTTSGEPVLLGAGAAGRR